MAYFIMTDYERAVLGQLERHTNLLQCLKDLGEEVAPWVVVAAFAGSFCAGVLIFMVLRIGKDSKEVW